MKLRFAPLIACALAAALVPAFADNGDPDDQVTEWTQPVPCALVQGNCAWGYRIQSNVLRDDNTQNPTDTGWIGTCDSYAHTIAEGMQVFGYAWAYDSTLGDDADASVSSGSAGFVQVFATTVPAGCVPIVQAFWQPRVRLRVDQRNPVGGCVAGAYMKGDVQQLNLQTELKQELVSKSSSELTSASLTVGVPLIVTIGVTVPITVSNKSGSLDATLVDNQHASRSISSATATYCGSSWVGAYANRDIWDTSAESEAWVWDSKPGLELEGYCAQPCNGSVTVQYGW